MEKIHFLNAGQGDCIVVESGKHLVVVDSNVPRGKTESPLLPFLRKRIEKGRPVDIDLLCISHPDRDHYDGLTAVLEFLDQKVGGKPIGQVHNVMFHGLLPIFNKALEEFRKMWELSAKFAPPPSGVTDYEHLCDRLNKVRNQFSPVGNGENMWKGGKIIVHRLGPVQRRFSDHLEKAVRCLVKGMTGARLKSVSPNEISTILRIEVNGSAILLPGDTSYKAWRQSVALHRNNQSRRLFRKAQIVKAPHHGSAKGQQPDFWDEVLSVRGYAVISAGQQYNHPSVEVVRKIVAVVGKRGICCVNLCSESAKSALVSHLDIEAPRIGGGECIAYHDDIEFAISPRGYIKCKPAVKCPGYCCPWH